MRPWKRSGNAAKHECPREGYSVPALYVRELHSCGQAAGRVYDMDGARAEDLGACEGGEPGEHPFDGAEGDWRTSRDRPGEATG